MTRKKTRRKRHRVFLAKSTAFLYLAALLPKTTASYAITPLIPRASQGIRHHHARAAASVSTRSVKHDMDQISNSVADASGSIVDSATASQSAVVSTSSGSSTTYSVEDPTITDPSWTFPLPFDTVLGTNFTTLSCRELQDMWLGE